MKFRKVKQFIIVGAMDSTLNKAVLRSPDMDWVATASHEGQRGEVAGPEMLERLEEGLKYGWPTIPAAHSARSYEVSQPPKDSSQTVRGHRESPPMGGGKRVRWSCQMRRWMVQLA